MQDIPNFPKKILHADDDPMIIEVVERALGDLDGVTLQSVQSGQGLIEVAPLFLPDLILLDLKLPDKNAPDIIEAIRNFDDPIDAPVIFFTGYRDVKMQEEYKNLGVIGVLHKPLSPGIIPERIRFMWCEHHGLPTNIAASGIL